MNKIAYSGEIWSGLAVAPQLWNLLLQKDLLLEFTTSRPPYQVILGVPHHAAPGVDRIAEKMIRPDGQKPGRPADETTGLTGLAVFQALQELNIPAMLVIAAHATDHDPNKTAESPYWKSLFPNRDGARPTPEHVPPRLILELHGAGKNRRHDLELSAGPNLKSSPLSFAAALAAQIPAEWQLAAQNRPGTREGTLFHREPRTVNLQNPALKTQSLYHAGELGIPALHLEMKSFLRRPDTEFPDSPRPTPEASVLARALAETVKAFLEELS
jgi:hypothetical protein